MRQSGFLGCFLSGCLYNVSMRRFLMGLCIAVVGLSVFSTVVPYASAVVDIKPMISFTLGADMNGDGRGEILAVSANGTLLVYPGTASGKLGSSFELGTGFSGFRVFGPGDVDGDGMADILGISTTGELWLFPGKGLSKLGTRIKVGYGWSKWRLIPAGDLNRDSKVDLLGVDSNGDLFMYAGKGNGQFKSKVKVGYGWTGWNLYSAGDLNKDGASDILGINSKGDLYQYLGKGTGSFHPRQKVGWGWQGFVLAAGSDLTGDGKADIIGCQESSGDLYFYQGAGNAKFNKRVHLDTGWCQNKNLPKPPKPPKGSESSHWADVNLTTQTVTLMNGKLVVKSFTTSSGKKGMETPMGIFSVYSKTAIQTLSGCAGGECWYYPGTKWLTWFYRDYGFHTAYWHNDFGKPRSHGCLNLREKDAKAVYDWLVRGDKVVIHK